MVIIFFGFFLRILLALYNIDYQTLPGVGGDAFRFHLEAIEFQNYLSEKKYLFVEYKYEIGWIYSVFLGYLYNIFGTSYLFSSILSCIVWLISALVFRKILIIIKIDYIKINYSLLFYSFLFPTTIIYSSVVLREVYMLCFTNFLLFYIITIEGEKKYFSFCRKITMILLFLFLLGIMHRSNILFVVLFLSSIVIYYIIKKLRLKITSCVLFGGVFIFIFYSMGFMETLFATIKSYQTGHIHPFTEFRASYYSESEIRSQVFSFFNFFKYISNNIINYFIQPSIFRINSPQDLLLAFENFIKLYMIFHVILKLFKYPSKNYLFHILVLMFFLSEIPYSQATINWGTASRHHMQVLGLLIVLFLYPLKKSR